LRLPKSLIALETGTDVFDRNSIPARSKTARIVFLAVPV
jgi:hypothetical protein